MYVEGKYLRASTDGSFSIGIVIDNVVYDCSEFVAVHPGGDTVIRSFGGQDCSCMLSKQILFVLSCCLSTMN